MEVGILGVEVGVRSLCVATEAWLRPTSQLTEDARTLLFKFADHIGVCVFADFYLQETP